MEHTKQTSLTAQAFVAQISDAPPSEIKKPSADMRAWLITSRRQPYFLKWVETARYDASLAKDAGICSRRLHPAITRLRNVIRTADGVLLVFEKAPGENLGDPQCRSRFFALPSAAKIRALRSIFGALAAIAEAGWILVDFYEGNVLYDFRAGTVTIFDFELFEPGDGFILQADRDYGSKRLMAPEEFVRGSLIDQTSNVFTLGRYAICALSARIDASWRAGFEADDPLADVLARATRPSRHERYPTVREFVAAFEQAARSASA